MSYSISESEWDEFITVLKRVQRRVNKKYGPMTIYNWRKKRLVRDKQEY